MKNWWLIPLVGILVLTAACLGAIYLLRDWNANLTAGVPNSASAQPGNAPQQDEKDLGTLLGAQPMTPVPGDLIDWDHLKTIDWREDKDLTGVQVLYAQSGVPNKISIKPLAGQAEFKVPEGTVLIFGGYSADVTIGNRTWSKDGGFYAAFAEGTVLRLNIRDGFALIAKKADVQRVFCFRIAQAVNEKWATAHLYRLATWSEPVCSGVYTTVLDNDR